jgi:hypothetical protein
VTFLSFACSGALIGHLVDQRYAGTEPRGGQTLEPQVEAVRRALGLGTARGTRTIDALMISAGGNDMDFADIVEDCAANVDWPIYDDKNCVTDRGIEANLASLDGRYDRLARAIRTRLPGTALVSLSDYPAYVFEGGGCRQLTGLTSGEGADMSRLGVRLNDRIAQAVRDHAGDRWRLAGASRRRSGRTPTATPCRGSCGTRAHWACKATSSGRPTRTPLDTRSTPGT